MSPMWRDAPNFKVADVHFDGFWKIVRHAGDFDGVDVLFDQATGFHADGFAIEVGRDVSGDRGVLID
jgi:hypothetical protein